MLNRQYTYEELLDKILDARDQAKIVIPAQTRQRILANNLTIHEVFKTIDFGEMFPCREVDRVKFVTNQTVVFVALGLQGTEEKAFIVSAFRLIQKDSE
jgi:hypothetical protein